jgi:uncharacterized protein (DUF1800 family)
MTDAKPAPAAGPWAAYVPSQQAPWDLRRVVHLHRRAGFAATWGEIRRDLADGPGPSVERLLTGTARVGKVPPDFEHTSTVLADAAVASQEPARLKAWWVQRMLLGPDPLGERLALLWHNHFATSNAKVDDLAGMRRQNGAFRAWARGPFGELLRRLVRDPALLVWLDAPENRKGQPNENLARELLELFTLGLGHYTERDVREAARALTGWTVRDGVFCEDPGRHDDGEKTILGQRGRWGGDDLVRILLAHPATAERLAMRLCQEFMGEDAVDRAALRALAEGLRRHDLDLGWGVATVLRSRAFFVASNLGNRVLAPAEYVLGAVRALELLDLPPSTLLLADWISRLGQDLFYPPNVGGWKGGRWWLSAFALVGRDNFASALVEGELWGEPRPFDALALAHRHGRGQDFETALGFYAELLLGTKLQPKWRDQVRAALGDQVGKPEGLRRAVALLLVLPEAQLG